ncbi:MAG: hypothetical protein OEN55_02005 [Alphaproteobacteria bacterium]|nr:hypothetical protein [Alphaproteobacteria bacterium]
MRVEIGVFFAESPLSDKDALQRFRARRGERDPDRSIEPGPRIAAFLGELTDRYPRLDALPEGDRASSPWSGDFCVSEDQVLIALGSSQCADAVELILELAERHSLVCFDPKTRSILTAPSGIHMERQSDAAIWPLTLATLSLALVGLLWLH